MNTYTVRQLDAVGKVVSEKQVEASGNDAALRQLKNVAEMAERIEVYDADNNRVGEIVVAYWRRAYRRQGAGRRQ